MTRTVGRHPGLFLSLPSLYLLLVYPPLWKDVDALVQLIWPAGTPNIVHFPPLYCFAGRIPFWIGDCVQAWLSGRAIPGLRLTAEQHPTWLGVESLIVTQHAALITALIPLVRTAASTPLSRGVVTLGCIAASSLYAQQQCAGSEAPSVSAIILLAAAGLCVYRKSTWWRWTAFTGALFVAFASRHINYALVLWLPLFFAGRLLWNRLHGKRLISPDLTKLGFALVCSALAFLGDRLVVRAMIAQAGQEYRTDLGFVLVDRIAAFLYKLSDSERLALAQKLAAAEHDPSVQVAIRAQTKLGSSHQQLSNTIQAALRQQGEPQATIEAHSDAILFKASLAYLKTLHPKLVDLILSDFLHGYVREDNGKLSLNRFVANRISARMRQDDPKAWEPLDQLHTIDNLETASVLVNRASADLYLMLWGPIPIASLVLVNVVLTVLLVRRNRGEIAWLAQSLLLTSAILYFINCILVYFNDRYTLPLLVCGVAGFAVQVGALLEGRAPARPGKELVGRSSNHL